MLLENCSNTGDLRPGPDALAFQAANADFFSGLFENRVTKIAAVTFSMIGSYSCIVLLYSIIWYEKFGSDCKRTLINRLFVYFWFYPLTWEATLQQLDMVRYIFGPLPRIFCRFTYFCKVTKMFLLYICIPQNDFFPINEAASTMVWLILNKLFVLVLWNNN